MTEQTTPLPPAPPPGEPPAPKVRRTLGLPVVGAIGGAALVIGLLVGGIIGYAVHSDGPSGDFRQGGPGRTFQQGGPGNGHLPPNGQPPGQGQQQGDSGSES